jgi:glucose-1-phosphate thymidylyltransferase
VIGPGVVVEDAVIGPNVSIEHDARVSHSTIDDSIVMEGAQIVGVHRLSGSILGRDVEVRHSGETGLHRLIVGDQSHVEVD